jgi:hypothetical protein
MLTNPFIGILECHKGPFTDIGGRDDRDLCIGLEWDIDQDIASFVPLDGEEEGATDILREEGCV